MNESDETRAREPMRASEAGDIIGGARVMKAAPDDDTFGEPTKDEPLMPSSTTTSYDDEEDIVTEDEYDKLISRHVFTGKDGEWTADAVFQLTDAKHVKSDGNRPGGLSITLTVVTPPAGLTPPKGGWPHLPMTFPKFGKDAPQNQQQQEQIAQREK